MPHASPHLDDQGFEIWDRLVPAIDAKSVVLIHRVLLEHGDEIAFGDLQSCAIVLASDKKFSLQTLECINLLYGKMIEIEREENDEYVGLSIEDIERYGKAANNGLANIADKAGDLGAPIVAQVVSGVTGMPAPLLEMLLRPGIRWNNFVGKTVRGLALGGAIAGAKGVRRLFGGGPSPQIQVQTPQGQIIVDPQQQQVMMPMQQQMMMPQQQVMMPQQQMMIPQQMPTMAHNQFSSPAIMNSPMMSPGMASPGMVMQQNPQVQFVMQ